MLRAVVVFVLLALAAGSVAGSAAADVTLVADSYVRSDTPSTNYGTAKEIRVRGGGSLVINGYLRFTVSGSAPSRRRSCASSSPTRRPGTGSVFRVLDNSWAETGVVWPGPVAHGLGARSKPAGAITGRGSSTTSACSSPVTARTACSSRAHLRRSVLLEPGRVERPAAPARRPGRRTAPTNRSPPSDHRHHEVGQSLHA